MKILQCFFAKSLEWGMVFTLVGGVVLPAMAQPIQPANDGTGTVVTPNHNFFDITGGSFSGDRANLFHSFTQFNLSEGQIANFISNPNIRNILGRINGGDASYINGLIQISGGNSNLFLMNPAGIVFGQNAALNVPADFTVTTATGLNFNQGLFNAIGNNNYAALVGNPAGFNFAVSQPGSIVNLGNLSLNSGSNLTLLGGNIINTGTLSSPGGNITLSAIPGNNNVRVSQVGHILNLEITPTANHSAELNPLSLPQLLTGSPFESANTLRVNEKGEVILTHANLTIPNLPATTIASGSVSSADNKQGGNVNILGNNVAVVDGKINVSGNHGGGTILVGGDYRGLGKVPNALNTLINANSTLQADAIESGNGGRVMVWGNQKTGFFGNISARGGAFSGNGGFVEVSGKENLIFRGNVNLSAVNGNLGNLLLDPENITIVDGVGADDSQLTDGQILFSDSPGSTFTISKTTLEAITGTVSLEATNNITLDNGVSLTFSPFGGAISFKADADNSGVGAFAMDTTQSITAEGRNLTISAANITTGNINTSSTTAAGGSITLNATNGAISTENLSSNSQVSLGGNISLNATSDVTINGAVLAGNPIVIIPDYEIPQNSPPTPTGTPGNITINSGGAVNTTAGILDASSYIGNSGSISINATGDILTNNILAENNSTASGGNISLTTTSGLIDTTAGDRVSSSSAKGRAGDININAAGNIFSHLIDARAENSQGGNINLNSGGNINVINENGIANNGGFINGGGGNINITAAGDILSGYFISRGGTKSGAINLNSWGNIETETISADVTSEGNASYVTINSGGNVNILYSASSNASNGDAGNVNITATGNVNTSIMTVGNGGKGGDITVNSTTGTANIEFINASSSAGNGGNVQITTEQLLTVGNINTSGVLQGGNISLTSNSSNVNLAASNLDASSGSGTPGKISIASNAGSIFAGSFNGSRNLNISAGGSDDILTPNPDSDSSADASQINSSSGSVSLQAHNDITINQPIVSGSISNLELRAGRNININANIDTSSGGGNIYLQANDKGADINRREPGTANITMTPGTSLNSGSGNILIELSTLSEVGNITLADLNTTGSLEVNASGGNVFRASETSLISAGNAAFLTFSSGGIGLAAEPLRINVTNLAAKTGSNGGYFESPLGGVTLGGIPTRGVISTSGGGNFSLTANGDITLKDNITTTGAANSGAISLTSIAGSINTTAAEIDTSSYSGNGAEINLTAAGDINTGRIASFALERGGNINLTSINGAINTTAHELRSESFLAQGGNVNISARGDIQTGYIWTSSDSGNGGIITITSSNGGINTTGGLLASSSNSGSGGAVSLTANGSINTRNITSSSNSLQGGNITLNSLSGGIDTSAGSLVSSALNPSEDSINPNIPNPGNGGAVSLTAAGNINTSEISSYAAGTGNGGNIAIISNNGAINSAGLLESYSNLGRAGSVTVNAFNDINFTGTAYSIQSQGAKQGGNINITSHNGAINTAGNDLQTYSSEGTGGDVRIEASGNVALNNVTTYGNLESGDVTIISRGAGINTANIQTLAPNGTSGNIKLNTFTTSGNITSTNITSSGSAGSGNITVDSQGNVKTANVSSNSQQGNSGNVFLFASADASTGEVSSTSQQANSGDVSVTAGGNVTTGDVSSTGNTGAGNVSVTSSNGTVTAGNISSISTNGNSGDINVSAQGNVTTGNLETQGKTGSGNITATSQQGALTTGNISSISQVGNSGNINLEAQNDVTVGNVSSIAGQNSGDINIISRAGAINAGIVQSVAGEGTAGIITLEAKNGINTAQMLSGGNLGGGNILNIDENTGSKPGKVFTTLPDQTIAEGIARKITGLNIMSGVSQNALASNINQAIEKLEQNRTEEYSNYLDKNTPTAPVTVDSIRNSLSKIAQQTGNRSAIIYVTALENELELILFTPEGEPVRHTIPQAPKEQLLLTAWQFTNALTDPNHRNSNSYMKPSQQLYNWLIAPIQKELQANKINTLLFSMDSGLRTLPVAALNDGQQFLIEKYSMGLIPSVSLMDTRYQAIQKSEVLAFGASEFKSLNALPAVPVELQTITQERGGKAFLNEAFTRNNIVSQRQSNPYPIVHFATHAEFKAGDLQESFIQLWDDKLNLNDLRELRLNSPSVELLVLSACRTAVGDEKAELGFAGLAVAAGVKSALASLWYVSDEGTLGLMNEFYDHLNGTAIKAEALREAQLAMLRGKVTIENGELRGSNTRGSIVLPPSLMSSNNRTLSHPYYWSGFTMIGSPW